MISAAFSCMSSCFLEAARGAACKPEEKWYSDEKSLWKMRVRSVDEAQLRRIFCDARLLDSWGSASNFLVRE